MRYITILLILFSISVFGQFSGPKLIENQPDTVWYLIYDTEEFLIFGYLPPQRRLATGREYLEQYATEEELRLRVDAIKNEGYYEENK